MSTVNILREVELALACGGAPNLILDRIRDVVAADRCVIMRPYPYKIDNRAHPLDAPLEEPS